MFSKPNRSDEDFDDEVQAHLQIEADRLVEEGMNHDEAMAAARRAFGNVTHSRERFYESRRWMWLDQLARDVRYACRQMRYSPISTATIILSVALGVGVNASIFSLADQALLRALPVAAPERLVQLDWNGLFAGGGLGFGSLLPHPFYRELREENDVFEDMFARSQAEVYLSVDGESEPVSVEVVTGSYFPALGVRAVVGRLFTDADDLRPDAHPLVVLSYDYWERRFGADPDVVGRQVRVNSYPMTVIGVAQPGFHGMDWSLVPAIWVPMMMNDRVLVGRGRLAERRERFLHVYAHLPEAARREQVEEQLQPWFRNYLRADTQREGWPQLTEQQMNAYMASRLDLLPGAHGQSAMEGQTRQPMLILLTATGLILLLACLNVANLLVARTLARRRATALRTALGASRGRILTEQLVESGLLAVAGGIAGALVAPLISRGILFYLPQQGAAGIGLSANLDLRVLSFALAITALVTLLSGVVPALYAASVSPVSALKQQPTGVAGGLGSRKAFVAGQFALALILLIGAGAFARTLGALRAQGPGFSTTNLLMFRVNALGAGYEPAESKTLVRKLLAEVQTLPDVEQAGVGRFEMLNGGGWSNPVTVESTERIVTDQSLPMNAVTPDFFATLGAPITMGRGFNESDSHGQPGLGMRSAIVNEEFVKRYVPNGNPIGARLGIGGFPDVVAGMEIVGVVRSFQNVGLREPEAQVFFSLWERAVGGGTFYVRARTLSEAAARSIRAAVVRIDPALAVQSLRTMDDQLDRILITERMLATAAGAFAVAATLLAMIGLYGVLSFSAALRSKEIGIRLALGAQRWSAGGLIVREAAVLAATGLVLALPLSWALGRLIENQLFGVHPMGAVTIAGAAAVLALVCLGASLGPMRKAGSVNPSDALRSD